MQFTLQTDTLSFQLNRAALLMRDMSKARLVPTAKMAGNFRYAPTVGHFTGIDDSEGVVASPEKSAIRFYLLNHTMALIRAAYHPLQPLPAEAVAVCEAYHGLLATQITRMFFYLLMICTRETRHLKVSSSSIDQTAIWQKYGHDVRAFFTSTIHGKGSEEVVSTLLMNPLDMELGAYCSVLVDIFFSANGFNTNYGGKAWGAVALALREFVHGRMSGEMLLDTGYTLAHNGGPIFNKGMLFEHQDNALLYRILDVQASGQIPQWIAETGNPFAGDLFAKCAAAVPGFAESYVDWFEVEKHAGPKSKHNYTDLKKAQVQKWGQPGTQVDPKMAAEAAKLSAAAAAAKIKIDSMKVQITPITWINKVEYEREAA